MNTSMPITWASLTATVCLLAASPSMAVDVTLEAFHEAEYSTNIGRTSEDEEEGWIHQPGARLQLEHNAPTVTLVGEYDARRRMYEGDTFDDDTTVIGSAEAEWRAIEDRLTFDAANYRTETTIDSRGAFDPENRQVISYTTAGATLRADSFGAHVMDFGYRYDATSADDTDTDSVGNSGNFSYIVPINRSQRVQLNASVQDMAFDDELSPDYVQTNGSLQYLLERPNFGADIALGYTEIDRELGRDTVSGTIGNAQFTWTFAETSVLALGYARDYSSQSNQVEVGIPDAPGGVRDNTNLNEVFVTDAVNASYSTVVGRNQFSIAAGHQNRNYEDVPNDDETTNFIATVERRIRPQVTGSLFAGVTQTDFEADGREDQDLDCGVVVTWTGFRRLTLSATVSYYQLDSDDDVEEFEEWQGVLRLGYRIFGPRT